MDWTFLQDPQQLEQTSPEQEPWISPEFTGTRLYVILRSPTDRHSNTLRKKQEKRVMPQRVQTTGRVKGQRPVAGFPDVDGLLSQQKPPSRLNRRVYRGLLAGLES